MGSSRLLKVLNTLVLRGLGSGIAVLLTLLASRYMTVTQAAAFLLLFNVTTVGAVCFRWGLDDVIVRRIASSSDPAARESAAGRLMLLAHRRVAIFGLAAAAIAVIAGAAGLDSGLRPAELAVALVVALTVALTACAGRITQGKGQTNEATVILNVLAPGLCLAGLIAFVGFGESPTSGDLMAVYGGVSLAAYAVFVWLRAGAHPRRLDTSEGRAADTADRAAANRLGGVVLAQQALNWGALLVVPLAYGERTFTSFMVTYKVAMLVSLVMLAINFTFASRIAEMHANQNRHELRTLTRAMTLSVGGASILAAIPILLFKDTIYSLGHVPERLDVVLGILLVSQALFAMAAVYALVLSMCHQEAFLLYTQGGIAALGLAVFVVVSVVAPIEVAALALAGNYAVLTIALQRRVGRLLK